MPQVIEVPTESKLPMPPSAEVTKEALRRAEANGYITKLGHDTLLKGISPELVDSVIANAQSLSKPKLH